jgi:hypothetical protein
MPIGIAVHSHFGRLIPVSTSCETVMCHKRAGGGAHYYIVRRVGVRGQVDWLYARLTPIGAEIRE